MRALFAGCLVAACTSQPHERRAEVDLPAPKPAITMSTQGSAREVAPPKPLSVADLVAEGQAWRITTPHGPIHVWIPRGYGARRAETVVYVHGFYTHVDAAWEQHRLPAQFASSAINAMFIACEAPADGTEPVSWTSMSALLEAVEQGIGQPVPRRRIVAVGHSGAWRTILGWLSDPILDTVVLLDAAYGEIESYRTWVLASENHRLIDVGDDTQKWTEQLHALLPETVIVDGFPSVENELPRDIAHARVLYIRSSLGHFPLITGGVALPMVLRTLRTKRLLATPLAAILASP